MWPAFNFTKYILFAQEFYITSTRGRKIFETKTLFCFVCEKLIKSFNESLTLFLFVLVVHC